MPISMPSRSELPGNLNRKKFAKALERLGFLINKTGGNGSHWKATCINTQKTIIIPQELRKDVLYYLLKEVEEYSSVTWEQIKNNL